MKILNLALVFAFAMSISSASAQEGQVPAQTAAGTSPEAERAYGKKNSAIEAILAASHAVFKSPEGQQKMLEIYMEVASRKKLKAQGKPLPEKTDSLTIHAQTDKIAAKELPENGTPKNSDDDKDPPIREQRKWGISFLLGAPNGVGLGLQYTPITPLTIGAAVDTNLATVTMSFDATWNIIWDSKSVTPTITAQYSRLWFTGLTDSIASEVVDDIYNDVDLPMMSGRAMDMGSILAGLDVTSKSGFHFLLRAGIVGQLGESSGGNNSNGEIVLKNWWGPKITTGIGLIF